MWHSSFLFQLLCNVNIQYLLIGHSWDLINHGDGRFNTVSTPADCRAPPTQVVVLFQKNLIMVQSQKHLFFLNSQRSYFTALLTCQKQRYCPLAQWSFSTKMEGIRNALQVWTVKFLKILLYRPTGVAWLNTYISIYHVSVDRILIAFWLTVTGEGRLRGCGRGYKEWAYSFLFFFLPRPVRLFFFLCGWNVSFHVHCYHIRINFNIKYPNFVKYTDIYEEIRDASKVKYTKKTPYTTYLQIFKTN